MYGITVIRHIGYDNSLKVAKHLRTHKYRDPKWERAFVRLIVVTDSTWDLIF